MAALLPGGGRLRAGGGLGAGGEVCHCGQLFWMVWQAAGRTGRLRGLRLSGRGDVIAAGDTGPSQVPPAVSKCGPGRSRWRLMCRAAGGAVRGAGLWRPGSGMLEEGPVHGRPGSLLYRLCAGGAPRVYSRGGVRVRL